jgi:hypothetical protein
MASAIFHQPETSRPTSAAFASSDLQIRNSQHVRYAVVSLISSVHENRPYRRLSSSGSTHGYGAISRSWASIGEMRASGGRGLLIYCPDFRCSHWTAISADSLAGRCPAIRHRAALHLPSLRRHCPARMLIGRSNRTSKKRLRRGMSVEAGVWGVSFFSRGGTGGPGSHVSTFPGPSVPRKTPARAPRSKRGNS